MSIIHRDDDSPPVGIWSALFQAVCVVVTVTAIVLGSMHC